MSYLAEQAARAPEFALRGPRTEGLDGRDAAFAHAIVDAALRRWITLAYVIQQGLNKPFVELQPEVRGALVGGAAQLVFLDRVPAHAAIDTSVAWAKARVREGAGGLVNAALRRVAELVGEREIAYGEAAHALGAADALPRGDGGWLKLKRAVLPGERRAWLAIATSHPEGLLAHWAESADLEMIERRCLHALVQPPVTLYTAKVAGEFAPAEEAGKLRWSVGGGTLELAPHEDAGHHVVTGGQDQLGAVLGARRDAWAQDAGSSRVVRALVGARQRAEEAGRDGLVIDLCAGLGTKTRQLRAEWPDARIVAADVDGRRLKELRAVFAGDERVRVVDARELPAELRGAADAVLLDVPCSNTGVLARRVEARYRLNRAGLQRLVEQQREILGQGAALLRHGGWLAYSTCSLEPDENQKQAAWAVEQLGLRLEEERGEEPRGGPGGPAAVYRDGFYHALLRRS